MWGPMDSGIQGSGSNLFDIYAVLTISLLLTSLSLCVLSPNDNNPLSQPFWGLNDMLRTGVSLVVQSVKNLPAMWETWVRSLGCKESLEESMATHSSILVWRIPMDRGAR